MAKYRHNWERSSVLLEEWEKSGGSPYLLLFEIRGKKKGSLAAAIKASTDAIRKPFSGDVWTRSKQSFDIAGTFKTLQISQSKAGLWIVRRWVVLAALHQLDDHAIQLLGDRIQHSWKEAVRRMPDVRESRFVPPRLILDTEARAVAQFINGCYSPIDAAIEPYATSLAVDYLLHDASENSPADLAAQYWAQGASLAPQFGKYGQGYFLTRVEDEFGMENRSGRKPSNLPEVSDDTLNSQFSPLRVPAKCMPFMDLALSMLDVDVFMARPTTNEQWNRVLAMIQIKKIKWLDPQDGWRSKRPTSTWPKTPKKK